MDGGRGKAVAHPLLNEGNLLLLVLIIPENIVEKLQPLWAFCFFIPGEIMLVSKIMGRVVLKRFPGLKIESSVV